MKRMFFLFISGIVFLSSCGGSADNTTIKMKASGIASPNIFASQIRTTKIDTCPESATEDDPNYSAGLDCDNDGGVINYISPSSFKVAIKKLAFIKDDSEEIEIIADAGKLSDSQVLDLTKGATLNKDLPLGTYIGYKAEIYYDEIKMDINSSPEIQNQALRVYFSDDDFESEGFLGHHQGDITFLDNNNNELGWVGILGPWTADTVQTDRGDIMGGGGMDNETGHKRGLYGSSDLWNQPTCMQGANKDIFILEGQFSEPVLMKDSNKIFSFSFDVVDTWFYEDFDGNKKFNPCENGAKDACVSNAAWSPIFKSPTVTVY